MIHMIVAPARSSDLLRSWPLNVLWPRP